MSVTAYSEYKDSGVEWIGEVPSHWAVQSIKWLTPVLRGASPRPIDDAKYFDDDGEYAWVRIADATASNGLLQETAQKLSELGSSLSVRLEPGALFLSIAGTVGKPCIAGIKACIHDGFVYFPKLSISPQFLFRIFEAGHCYGGLGKMGTQLNLNTDTVGSIRVPLPPREELTKILLFLDRETAKIDVLVAEQERLIALLKEKRQAVISHAVTKGLNPHAPMKDSGIEWLGEVPRHWDVKPLKHGISFIESGVSVNAIDVPATGDEIGVLKTSAVYTGQFRSEENKAIVQEERERASCPVKAGCLIVSRMNTPDLVGAAGLVMQDAPNLFLPDRLWQVHLGALMPTFAHLWTQSRSYRAQVQLACAGTSSSMQNLSLDEFKSFICPFPPLTEQAALAEQVAETLMNYDNLMAEAQAAIALLQERRAALISATVTGKIDVRRLVDRQELDAA